jgi:hypothetical protein
MMALDFGSLTFEELREQRSRLLCEFLRSLRKLSERQIEEACDIHGDIDYVPPERLH